MDLALTINAWIDEEIMFAQQLGARSVFARVDAQPGSAPGWDGQHLSWLANRVEKAGLALAGLQAAEIPVSGSAMTESALDGAVRLIAAAGAANIGLVNLAAGAAVRSEELPALAEAAARAGVKLALPAALLAGATARPSAAGLVEALRGLPDSAGLNASADLLPDWLQQAAPSRLYLVSIENEQRPTGKRSSARFDELLPICWRLRQAGYTGLIRLGQPSKWKGDTSEDHQARAFSAGYFRAALQAFTSAGAPR
jgi:hypothetical protein